MIVIDCEIKKMIPDSRAPQLPGIEYCIGWTDYVGMGLAVCCAYDYATQKKYAFWDDPVTVDPPPFDTPDYINGNLTELQALIDGTDYVIGYNNHTFDNKLLSAHFVEIQEKRSYDIYPQIIDAAGLSNSPFTLRKGYKLNDVAKANRMGGKSGSGEMAPVLWQQRRLLELRDYCFRDVRLTKRILDKIMLKSLLCARTGRVMNIPTPAEVLGTVQPKLSLQ
jgi:hypothetical protein